MNVQPYLFFDGRCEEALDFYRDALGAEVVALIRFQDSPEPSRAATAPPGNKIMHATFRIGAQSLMASDGECGGGPAFAGFSLALETADEAEAERCFAALAEGGVVTQPLIETFFSPRFGMATDRFGVGWMVTVAQQPAHVA